jgi:3-oxoacyl-[acyl-carrier-protein] synthase II
MDASKRVVITGLGAIAPNGSDTESFWSSTLKGVSGIREVKSFDTSGYPCHIAGEVLDFCPEKLMGAKLAHQTTRFTHLGAGAALMALHDAGLANGKINPEETAVIFGIACPPIKEVADHVADFQKYGFRKSGLHKLSAEDSHSAAAIISAIAGTKGFSLTITTRCTAGLNSVGMGCELIRQGQAEVVICGGADAPVSPYSYAVFCSSGLLSRRSSSPHKASRPFDAKRDGGVLSEGAGSMVLESLRHALERKVRIYGEVAGYAMLTDGAEAWNSDSKELSVVTFSSLMTSALARAGIGAEDVDYICAHAPSDPLLDKVETLAVKAAFGKSAYRIPISSIKSEIGNPVAAAGVLQGIVSLLAMRDGVIPPTINYEYPDPECDLDCVPNELRRNPVDIAVVNSHGLGGNYSVLVLKRCVG